MCNAKCLDFVITAMANKDMSDADILEVGSLDVNGTPRSIISADSVKSYLGVDIISGKGVDQICDVQDLVSTFGENKFNIVITTEMLEHVLDWRSAINNMKDVTKPGGVLIITTRSKRFGLHDFPGDYWRYELDDMRAIFADWEIELLEPDHDPGVFVKARKPLGKYQQVNLDAIELYSMANER